MAEQSNTMNPPPYFPQVSGIVDKTSTVAEKVSQTVTGTVSSSIQSIKEFSGNYGVTIFVAILLAIIILFIAYILYNYISGIIANKILWIVPESKVPIIGTNYNSLSGDGIPTQLNGRRMTFMFWIYIHDLNRNAGSYRHILHRGDQTIEGASPLVMMDKTLNKLYIRFAGSKEAQLGSWDDIILNAKKQIAVPNGCTGSCTSAEQNSINEITDGDAILYDLATHGISVDYVPLQRWVQITVVINESINQGSMSLFMDGELVKTHSSSEYYTTTTGTRIYYNFQNLNIEKKGDIWIGGDATNSSAGIGFSGLIGKVIFTNYDMNTREVYKNYLTGPIDNLTSKLGLPAYGVRSPIYRIG
uniref:Lectin/glucanase superfamily protein n=1 Tax=viral metagenome TaxID=1070528 RepID=A0A6C0CTX4_9ZZZZ